MTPGRPYPLANCSLYNSTAGVEVSCSPGFDGGLTQMFVLEVSLALLIVHSLVSTY